MLAAHNEPAWLAPHVMHKWGPCWLFASNRGTECLAGGSAQRRIMSHCHTLGLGLGNSNWHRFPLLSFRFSTNKVKFNYLNQFHKVPQKAPVPSLPSMAAWSGRPWLHECDQHSWKEWQAPVNFAPQTVRPIGEATHRPPKEESGQGGEWPGSAELQG